VAKIDPDGQWLTVAEEPIGELTTITITDTKQIRRVHAGRVVDGPDMQADGWSNRGAFSGDTAASMAAKRAGITSRN
jgi:hypothetical protein